MRAWWSTVLLAGCSVPALSLDGKQCPCVEAGYVCDTQTNLCLATNDGGGIIDSLAATPCLPTAGETEIYRYTGTFDWLNAGGKWAGTTEISQTNKNAMDTYAFPASSAFAAPSDYHVISSMREVGTGGGTPSIGIVLRAQPTTQNKARYSCTWTPKTRTLQLETLGSNTAVLATSTVADTVGVPTSFTMEASVKGSTLSCCIREIEGAGLINAVDPAMAVPAGTPGLTTTRMQAAFGSFVVLTGN